MYIHYFDKVLKILDGWWEGIILFAPKFLVAVVVFSIFYFTSTRFSKLILNTIDKKSNPKSTEAVVMILNISKFLFILAGVFVGFEIMGISGFIFKFIGSLGVAGVIAGVALKDIVSSIFSGMLIGFDKAFSKGDHVQITGISGIIEDIGLLTTKLISDEGKKYHIPNQQIFSAPFINFSASGRRRIFMEMEIPSTENIENANRIITEELKKLEGVDIDLGIQVVCLRQLQGVFVLSIRFWLKENFVLLEVQSNAYIQLRNKLDQEGVSMIDTNIQKLFK